MSKYRQRLPQLGSRPFLTDGGLETTLVFHHGYELPAFAAFDLLKDAVGRRTLLAYLRPYLELALRYRVGLVLESVTWRANRDWGKQLGYSPAQLDEVNRLAIEQLEDVRALFETDESPLVISGCIGPRGDGYVAGKQMTADEATEYHAAQVATFADTAADMISGFTLNYVAEAIGIARAAAARGMPVVISFTVETDGRLPSGASLVEAIEQVDAAAPEAVAYYMINCAHPSHFAEVVSTGAPRLARLQGLRANASCKSHAELDEATELDIGDPAELGRQYRQLLAQLPQLRVLGGCCGTDHRHVAEISAACLGMPPAATPSPA